jgi:hypothetical protein
MSLINRNFYFPQAWLHSPSLIRYSKRKTNIDLRNKFFIICEHVYDSIYNLFVWFPPSRKSFCLN